MRVVTALEEFAAELQLLGRNDKYTRSVSRHAAELLRHCATNAGVEFESLELDQVRRADLLAAMMEYRTAYKPTSFRSITSRTKQFLQWCADLGYVARSPMAAVPLPSVPRQRRKAITEDEFLRVLHQAGTLDRPLLPKRLLPSYASRDQLIVLLSYCVGLRAAEIAGLRVDDLTDDAADGGPGVWLDGKAGHSRWVPFAPAVKFALDRWLRDREQWLAELGVKSHPHIVLPLSRREAGLIQAGKPLLPTAVVKLFRRLMDAVGASRDLSGSSHAGRRSFATRGCQGNRPCFTELEMAAVLGHASDVTLQRYRIVEPRDVSSAVVRHPNAVAALDYFTKTAGYGQGLGEAA